MSMTEFTAPAGEGFAEFVEKRSRFIGHVAPVSGEDDARGMIERIKTEYHDARHNCWCFITGAAAGNSLITERYSDDGEPQGTAGLPMLDLFRRGGIHDVCCVVTRYFGGILLGPGGLLRAYSEAARLALADAGTTIWRLWECYKIPCPYNLQGRVKTELDSFGGVIENTEYAENVMMSVRFPVGTADVFSKRLMDISGGALILNQDVKHEKFAKCSDNRTR